MNLGIVILAAGQGTRMKSSLPKVLHPLGGKPLLRHVIDTALALDAGEVVTVYGHGGEAVVEAIAEPRMRWALQDEQLGTGHAVMQAMPGLDGADRVLVLYGDVPLIRPATLRRLLDAAQPGTLGLLTAEAEDPTGYGRVVRDAEEQVQAIVEHKDATSDELRICEINTGILVVERPLLADALARLSNDNAQGEYYLTDLIAMAVEVGVPVVTVHPDAFTEVEGVNDRVQLARLERVFQHRKAEELMRNGVTLADPDRFDLRGRLSAGTDVTIDVNVLIEGDVRIGEGARIGANTVLRDCSIEPGAVILENCVIEKAVIGHGARVGPFSRIRPGTELADHTHVGNFVELKNARVSPGAKINHLSYVGDASIGERVNIGAGTITCNYDGANKHRTTIGDDAFIGSNTALVAPVEVGAGATIGAGSTISRDAPAGELSLTRPRQVTVPGWKRPKKKT